LEKLGTALCFWGCFQAINHGIEPAFLDKVREVTKKFFALPLEEKQKYAKQNGSDGGYGNDIHPTLNWSDRLFLALIPEDRRQLKFWPENPESFSQIIFKAFARSINLEENCFQDMFGEQTFMFGRFFWYPPCLRPNLVLGVFPHTDGSGLTVLLPDKEVEGLQFLKDDQWYRVPVIPEAFVIMSNGIFKSPVHRVVTNSERERMSVAVFCCPNPEKDIEPGVVNEARPRLYKTLNNYNRLYFENLRRVKKGIEAAML
ncbi:hypothetical protein CISIN_1g041077mg, partial [Citrus sinensis]